MHVLVSGMGGGVLRYNGRPHSMMFCIEGQCHFKCVGLLWIKTCFKVCGHHLGIVFNLTFLFE